MACADSQASQCAAFPAFMCKMVVCSAMLPEQNESGKVLWGTLKSEALVCQVLHSYFFLFVGRGLSSRYRAGGVRLCSPTALASLSSSFRSSGKDLF